MEYKPMGCKQKWWASSVAEVIKSRGAFSTLSSFRLPAGCIGFSGNARTLGMMQPLNGGARCHWKQSVNWLQILKLLQQVACPENIFTPYLSPDSLLLTPWLCSHSTYSGSPSGSPLSQSWISVLSFSVSLVFFSITVNIQYHTHIGFWFSH